MTMKLSQANNEQLKKRKKTARPLKRPDDVEQYYRVQMQSLIRQMKKSVEQDIVPVVRQSKAGYTADAWSDDIEAAINKAWGKFSTAAMESKFRDIAREVVNRITKKTTQNMVKSVNQSTGVNMAPIFEEQDMSDFISANIKNNTSMITSIRDEYMKSVENAIWSGTAGQSSPTDIVGNIRDQTGVSERRAKMIARDQTGKITSQVTERRHKQAGIEYYQSIDAGDERVAGRPGGKYPNARISCWGIARRDIGYGKGVYKVSEGASWGGETGLHPGRHHPLCRCISRPVFKWQLPDN